MCGRLVIYSPLSSYAEYLEAESQGSMQASYNIPPTSMIPACRLDQDGERVLTPMRWGLVPRWSRGPDSRFSMFNARAETVHEKPAFRSAFKSQRCLIPADGFYEWKTENGKQPYFFHRNGQGPLVMAGLWEHWQDAQGNSIDSCTIIVTGANAVMQPVHDRMPVLLDPAQFADWLEPANQDVEKLRDMLQPYAGSDLECYPVRRVVNKPGNDSDELIKRVYQ